VKRLPWSGSSARIEDTHARPRKKGCEAMGANYVAAPAKAAAGGMDKSLIEKTIGGLPDDRKVAFIGVACNWPFEGLSSFVRENLRLPSGTPEVCRQPSPG
jgi:hypothetical protein